MPEISYAALPRLLVHIATTEVVYENGLGENGDLVRCTIAAAFVGYGKDRPQAWAEAAYAAITQIHGDWKPAQHIERYVHDRKGVR